MKIAALKTNYENNIVQLFHAAGKPQKAHLQIEKKRQQLAFSLARL